MPFLGKPLHLDDPVYVWVAQHIRANPLDFYGFHLNWQGHDEPVSRFLESPPLLPYFLTAVSLVGGFRAFSLHLAILPINLLSLIGMSLLARRFCRRAVLAALMLLLCPAFFVSATTLMCEPLMICLWIWAIAVWIIGTDRSPSLLPLAGAIALAAILTKYIAISILPLLVVYSICRPSPRRVGWIQAVSLLIPIAGAIAFECWTSHRYGSGAFSEAADYLVASHKMIPVPPAVKLLNTFCFVGGSAAACVAFLPFVFPRWLTLVLIVCCGGLAVVTAAGFLPPDGWLSSSTSSTPSPGLGIGFYSQYAFWMVCGIALLLLAIVRLDRSIRRGQWQDELFLTAWIGGVFIFACFMNWCINARVILPMLPPLCILMVRGLDSVSWSKARSAAVVLSAILAVTIARADFNLATTIRQAALEIPGLVPASQPAHRPLWFAGHWGFQYYLESTGAVALDDRSPQFKPGDEILFPTGVYGGTPVARGFQQLRRFEIGPRRWVATAQPQMGAGFYCSYGYDLPFVFGPIPPETFTLVQATPASRISP